MTGVTEKNSRSKYQRHVELQGGVWGVVFGCSVPKFLTNTATQIVICKNPSYTFMAWGTSEPDHILQT